MPRVKPKKDLASFIFQHGRLSQALKEELFETTKLDELDKKAGSSIRERMVFRVETALSDYFTYSHLRAPRPANRRAELQQCVPLLENAAKALKGLSNFAKADLFLSPLPPLKTKSHLSKVLQRLPELVDELHTLHFTSAGAIKVLGKKGSQHGVPSQAARNELIRTLSAIFEDFFQQEDEDQIARNALKTHFVKEILKGIGIPITRHFSSLCASSNHIN